RAAGGVGGLAEEGGTRSRAIREGANARVVGVEEREAVVGQGRDELSLSRSDRLDARRAREMHRPLGDRRDDADPRPDEPAEIGDLTGDVEADLDDGDLVRRLHLEERERDADLVVVRSGGPQHAMARAERRGGRLLCRRLPYVAGDPDSGDRVRVAERVGEPAQGVERVGDLDDKRAVRDSLDWSLYDGRARAPREGVGDEVVPVALVAQGEEHGAGLRDAGIERATGEPLVGTRHAVDDPTPRRLEQLLEGEHVRSMVRVGGLRPPAPNMAQGRSGGP